MASAGLSYIGVEVFYQFVPPRFRISCDLSELYVQRKEALDRMNEIGDKLRSTSEQFKDSSLTFQFIPPAPPAPEGSHDARADQPVIHIRLMDDTEEPSTNTNAPPVHLWINLLPDNGKERREHFVVDDFWDFSQIKFDELVTDLDGLQLEDLEGIDTSRYAEMQRLGALEPDVQKLVKEQRISDAEKMYHQKKVDDQMRMFEDDLMEEIR